MPLEAVINHNWRYTRRPWSCEFGDTLGGRVWLNLEIYSKIVIESVWRCTWTRWLCEPAGRNWESLEIHLEAMIERVWRCTGRPWLNEFRDTLGGSDSARSDKYWEVVNGWHAGCWNFIHSFVNMQPWECVKVILPFGSHGGLADGCRLYKEASQKLKLHLVVNS
jgi:hypothetical protein